MNIHNGLKEYIIYNLTQCAPDQILFFRNKFGVKDKEQSLLEIVESMNEEQIKWSACASHNSIIKNQLEKKDS